MSNQSLASGVSNTVTVFNNSTEPPVSSANRFLNAWPAYDLATFRRHQVITANNMTKYLGETHTAEQLAVTSSHVVAEPYLVYKIVTQSRFLSTPGYAGPTEGDVASRTNPSRRVPALLCNGGVNIPRFSTSHGDNNPKGYFIGGLLGRQSRVKLPGLSRSETGVELLEADAGKQVVYLAGLAEDAGIHADLVVKAGRTGRWTRRRQNHASTHGGPTSVLLKLQVDDEYDLSAVEQALLAFLSPWRAYGQEYFRPPPILLHDLMKLQTVQQLMSVLVAYGSDIGAQVLATLNQHVILGQTHSLIETRNIQIVQQQLTPTPVQ